MIGHVDGNALAGVLSELFRFDVTTARVRCASCGDLAVLATAMVYGGEQGLVVRCGECGDALMVVIQVPGRTRIQLRGAAWIEA
jgi:ribosomal protein S27E